MALLQVDRHPIAWTVWLFDAHQAGEPLSRSLFFAAPAVALQSLLLGPCLLLLLSGPSLRVQSAQTVSTTSNFTGNAALSFVAFSLSLVLLWPLVSNGSELLSGFQSLVSQRTLWQRMKQILFSTAEAGIAAYLALQICVFLREKKSRSLRLIVILPGLCGALVLSLCLLALFQLPVIHRFYDTWLPMLTGHTLLMLPRAFLLVALLNVLAPASSQHSGDLLYSAQHMRAIDSARRLSWILRKRRWIIAFAVLTHWCFWDVTIASTLRPVRFEPIVTRLYNEMHYGRTETLVAITVLALAIPAIVFAVSVVVFRQLDKAVGHEGNRNT